MTTAESLDRQIGRLASFIIEEIPGEPSQNQGAVDTAIRIMRDAQHAPRPTEFPDGMLSDPRPPRPSVPIDPADPDPEEPLSDPIPQHPTDPEEGPTPDPNEPGSQTG